MKTLLLLDALTNTQENRYTVLYSKWFNGKQEWLGFDLDTTYPEIINQVREAVLRDDVEEVMALWDSCLHL
jgi:hypothetical protein